MTDAADDFDALFEEVSAERNKALAAAAAPVKTAPAAKKTPKIEKAAKAVKEVPPLVAVDEETEDQSGKLMFERLGGIVRMLHDSLRQLGYDRSISTVATQITDAQDRLGYIANLTEQAANKVLNAVDVGIPEQDLLQKKAKDMNTRWGLLFEGKLNLEEFKALSGDSRQFAAAVSDATESEKARLLEIMMAQDFQDITGQLIKKIVVITHAAERELAQLLRDSAPSDVKGPDGKSGELMQGPSVPTKALEQGDVDSLLAGLGF